MTIKADPDKSGNSSDLPFWLPSRKPLKPIFGYRFVISGDFNGDGKQERLTEHFFSVRCHGETNKWYAGLTEYNELVNLTIEKEPWSFVTSDNGAIDTLNISRHGYGQLFGLAYLKNEGDLNGDSTDEVSYVVNWADWSNGNTWHIVTFRNRKWKELYQFDIWDWQLPDLPETLTHYGLFGLDNKTVTASDKEAEQELLAFEGLVKKIRPHVIRVVFKNREADMDTAIIDLRTLK